MIRYCILFIFFVKLTLILNLERAYAANELQYSLHQNGKKEFIEFNTENGILFSKNCINVSTCIAKKAYTKYQSSLKNQFIQKTTSAETEICHMMKGQLKILEDNKLRQRNFCFFSDASAISLKELF